jgi:type I restriction enzyme S subunit
MEKLKNIPSLRFPEFNENWELKTLGEVGEIVTGLTYSPKDISSDGVLVLRSSNVKDRLIKLKDNVFVKTTNFNKVINNDILICVRNGSKNLIGKNALITKNQEGLAFGAFMIIYRSKLNSFIFQLFDTQKYYKIIKENLGATINSINNSDLRKFEFLFPSLQEQTKIASFLTAVDDKLQALKQKKTLLEQYKKGVMQKIFSQELRFKDDNGNDYPNWEEKKLGDVLVKNSKKNKNQEFKLVQSVSNKRGFVNQDEYFEDRIIASKDLSNYYVIQKGDFAYNPSRIDVGSLAYKFDNNTSVISPLYISFKAVGDSLADAFLLEWFTTQEFTRQMNSSFEGSVRNTLSYESLRKIDITFPCIEEQTKIANFLSAIDEKINHCQSQIEKTEVWKKGLLQQMFV